MYVSDYVYNLPEDRIAKYPPKERGSTRLLVLHRETGAMQDSYYRNLDDFLRPSDLLILNDTRVMQSRLFCTLPDGRKREIVVLEKHGDEPQRVMHRGKLHTGDKLALSGITITVSKILGNGIAEVESETPLAELAEKYGTVPLPPYLHRDADKNDTKRYQTIWAKHMGSAAAPTASLNMTEDLLDRLKRKGVIIKYLTLHVGLGTFLPMRTEKVEDHKMHSEWFNIPDDTLCEIKRVVSTRQIMASQAGDEPMRTAGARRVTAESGSQKCFSSEKISAEEAGRICRACGNDNDAPRIIALGTTVARTLEYYARTGKTTGEDDIFIYPGFKFQLVDALLTNFHAPKSTVLMLASAFAGWEHLHKAYDYAVEQGYNFLSYGDSMLIC